MLKIGIKNITKIRFKERGKVILLLVTLIGSKNNIGTIPRFALGAQIPLFYFF